MTDTPETGGTGEAPARTSATLRTAVLDELHKQLTEGVILAVKVGDDTVALTVSPPPATITAAVGYLKAFPPKDDEDAEAKAREVSERLERYGDKVVALRG